MATTPRPRVEIVLLLVVAWLALCGLEWHVIAGAANETGDSAANSLLVQDAKSLVLLTGNYSRVGFNHPGPALLYMLAFGEWAFHDVLHVAPSPYGGQLIALALCNAGWIVAGFGVLRRIAGSASSAALMGSVFLVAATDSNAGMLASAWFPHLYILPFHGRAAEPCPARCRSAGLGHRARGVRGRSDQRACRVPGDPGLPPAGRRRDRRGDGGRRRHRTAPPRRTPIRAPVDS